MIRIIFNNSFYYNFINNTLNKPLKGNGYNTEYAPNYELGYHKLNEMRKLKGIRFHAYKNYGLSKKPNDIKKINKESLTFLFGDKIISK